mmetsp:Transcript_22390/g.43902  ORF Transcript_22390/g.43902 Transcript_22390/m.43902 type:complete len:617 (-) Transcript_22390:70-1920(-)|eukprot:CAMPEP_0171492014 /NCGR_PEP_ID=MMETSP0958-20121227/4176_1 /TAXON_ID=87120 /ORGANISM="Aurantiochytrium limacinum, Strain ATCCMYA-1381" /LENGTH=616 /DNA_ID=CAMNT_0012025489 /DNA_START=78 /DNA_END=1928 /DNA_ORIENTATION=-
MKTVTPIQGANASYDFIVIGGGSAGATLAARLSEDKNVSVLLIEAGGEASEIDAKIPAAAAKMQNSERDWGYSTEPCGEYAFKGLQNKSSYIPRGRCLGGSSILNYMAYVRGAKEDFDTWERMGAKGWSYKDVLPYFIKSEDCRVMDNEEAPIENEYHGRGGPLTTSVRPPLDIIKRYVRAAVEVGFKHADYNGREMDGVVGLLAQTIRDGARCDTATAFLQPASNRSNLTIMTNAYAKRLLFNADQTKVLGVEVGDYKVSGIGAGRSVWARREVILSCGAIDTPKVMLLSGLGPREHLEKVGVPCIKDMPDVGRNLEDHINGYISFQCKDSPSVNTSRAERLQCLAEWGIWGTGLLSTGAYDVTAFYKTPEWAAEQPGCGPDIQLGAVAAPGDPHSVENNLRFGINFLKGHYEPDSEGYILLTTLLHPYSKGVIELRNKDPNSSPRIISNYLKDDRDALKLAKAMRRSLEIARAPSLAKITVGDPILPVDLLEKHGGFENDEFWIDYARHYAMTLYHPACTCAIGKVVDERLRVYGLEGLRIADASVMPQVISGNTNAPSIMIGERAADFIKQEYNMKEDYSTAGPGASAASGTRSALVVAAAAMAGGLFAFGRL